MDERRKFIRRRVLKAGTIVFNHGRSTASCTLRNLSDGGALLRMANAVTVPQDFVLAFEGKAVVCHAVRRTLSEIGVAFQQPLSA
ncbi:MAG: PilZ domain-containing protein [Devosia sp.]